MISPSQPDIVQSIRNRTSWRAYAREPLDDATFTALREAMAEVVTPFGNEPRFELISTSESGSVDLRGMVTYGIIKDPPAFLVGAVTPAPKALEDFAFAFEGLLLKATQMGLGTCWLGGTFSRSVFARALRLGADEIMPAISPIGKPTAQRALRDKVMRFVASSRNRKPWNELFFDGNPEQPLTEIMAGPSYATVLEMVRLAPSARNRQPWRIIRDAEGKCFDLYVFREQGLQASIKPGGIDMFRLDAGIALCHFEWTARALGLAGRWAALSNAPEGEVPNGFEFIARWQAS